MLYLHIYLIFNQWIILEAMCCPHLNKVFEAKSESGVKHDELYK